MQPGQLYRHHRTGKLYRVLIAHVPGKATDNTWIEGLVYVGCYDGKPRWTSGLRWVRNFTRDPAAEKEFEDEG